MSFCPPSLTRESRAENLTESRSLLKDGAAGLIEGKHVVTGDPAIPTIVFAIAMRVVVMTDDELREARLNYRYGSDES